MAIDKPFFDASVLIEQGFLPADQPPPTDWSALAEALSEERKILFEIEVGIENGETPGDLIEMVVRACDKRLPISRIASYFNDDDTAVEIHYRHAVDGEQVWEIDDDELELVPDGEFYRWLSAMAIEHTPYRLVELEDRSGWMHWLILPAEALRVPVDPAALRALGWIDERVEHVDWPLLHHIMREKAPDQMLCLVQGGDEEADSFLRKLYELLGRADIGGIELGDIQIEFDEERYTYAARSRAGRDAPPGLVIPLSDVAWIEDWPPVFDWLSAAIECCAQCTVINAAPDGQGSLLFLPSSVMLPRG